MRHYISYTNRRHNEYGAGTLPGYGAHVRGWSAGARVIVHGERDERDSFSVLMTSGSNGGSGDVLLGTVHDTPGGPRWEPADAGPPARVGSPALRVLAAIPVGTDGDEYICTILQEGHRDGPYYGTVRAWRHRADHPDPWTWHATGGHYDFMARATAYRDMAERAGIRNRPDPEDLAQIADLFATVKSDAAQDVVCPDDIARLEELVNDLVKQVTR